MADTPDTLPLKLLKLALESDPDGSLHQAAIDMSRDELARLAGQVPMGVLVDVKPDLSLTVTVYAHDLDDSWEDEHPAKSLREAANRLDSHDRKAFAVSLRALADEIDAHA